MDSAFRFIFIICSMLVHRTHTIAAEVSFSHIWCYWRQFWQKRATVRCVMRENERLCSRKQRAAHTVLTTQNIKFSSFHLYLFDITFKWNETDVCFCTSLLRSFCFVRCVCCTDIKKRETEKTVIQRRAFKLELHQSNLARCSHTYKSFCFDGTYLFSSHLCWMLHSLCSVCILCQFYVYDFVMGTFYVIYARNFSFNL